MTTMYEGNGSMASPTSNGEGSGRDRGAVMSKRLTATSIGGGNRNTNRYSVTALYSMAAEQDVDVEDDLARGECG